MMLRTLMKDYLREEEVRHASPSDLFGLVSESIDEDVPLQVEESDWALLAQPERMVRKYEFPDIKIRNWFLRELFEDENNSGHFGKITISGHEILIEVWTHDVDAVTELDVEYASRCDDIYNDVELLGEFGYEY